MCDKYPNESWLPVVGHEGKYWVSHLGRVKSRYRLLNGSNDNGYRRVALGRSRIGFIHHLVMEAFIGPRPNGHDVNHINFVRSDNRLVNLEYITHVENGVKSAVAGRRYTKLSHHAVIEIRERLRVGEKQKTIASDYGVSPSLISGIAAMKRGCFTGVPMKDLRQKGHKVMNQDEVDQLMKLRSTTEMTVLELAKMFGVGITTVNRKLKTATS